MSRVGAFVRSLDPRLKMVAALVLGPALWKIHIAGVAVCLLVLLVVVIQLLSGAQDTRMLRTMGWFVLLWVGVKAGLDSLGGVPLEHLAFDALQLAVRLISLLLLGLALSLSASPRALGLAVSWFLKPVVGGERAWRIALSLALMVHFLPVCLTTMNEVREYTTRRCPSLGFFSRLRVMTTAVIRNLGQKTWNQTLAVACRGLESPEAWTPYFAWERRDWVFGGGFLICVTVLFLL